MLKLKSLKFSNIGRFVEEQTIDFTTLTNLVQIDAINHNTDGSSGSGKSTVLHAFDWLLGISDLSTTVLQSRLTKDCVSVTGYFDWDEKPLVINRSKKLSITVDGVETSGSSKLAEELLDQILSIPRDLFRVLVHKRQNEQGFFLQLTPAKMNEFLTDCLNLSSISNKIDLVDEKYKVLAKETEQYKSSLEALQAGHKATEDALAFLGLEPVCESNEELLESFKDSLYKSKEVLINKEEEHKKEKMLLDSKKPTLITTAFDDSELNNVESNIKSLEHQISVLLESERTRQNKINQEINTLKSEFTTNTSALKLQYNKASSEFKIKTTELLQVIKTGEEAKTLAFKIAGQIKVLKSGVCHTCEQGWATEASKIEETKLLSELDKCKTFITNSITANEEVGQQKNSYLLLTDVYNSELAFMESKFKESVSLLSEQVKPQIPSELPVLNDKLSKITGLKLVERQKESDHNRAQTVNNQKILEIFLSEQKSLSVKQQEEIKSLKNDFENTRAVYEHTKNDIDTHKKLLESYTYNKTSLNNKLVDMNSKLVHMNQKAADVKEQLEIADEVTRCLKSYLSCSFDDALLSISETATRILRAVPTMANATIRLEGVKESSSTGIIKEQINACLDSDGELNIPIKSLSGGERSAVDLAIDLAVSELISERSKVGINLLLLDEVMNGFDTLGKEQAIEMLKTIPDKHVLIIEHDPIAKELINERITVIRENETSYLK